MSTASTVEKCTEVTLLRPDGGPQTFTLPRVRRSRTCCARPAPAVRSSNAADRRTSHRGSHTLEVRHDDHDRPRAA